MAGRVALRRAAHQFLDRPKVFDDPFAIPILGVSAGELAGRLEAAEAAPVRRQT